MQIAKPRCTLVASDIEIPPLPRARCSVIATQTRIGNDMALAIPGWTWLCTRGRALGCGPTPMAAYRDMLRDSELRLRFGW